MSPYRFGASFRVRAAESEMKTKYELEWRRLQLKMTPFSGIMYSNSVEPGEVMSASAMHRSLFWKRLKFS